MGKSRPGLHHLLDEHLSRLQANAASLEDLAGEGTEHAHTLGPLLKTAEIVRQALQPSPPSETFIRDAETRLLNQLRRPEEQAQGRRFRSAFPLGTRPLRVAPWAVGLVLAGLLVLGSIGVAQASAATLPGDGFYSVKRGIEEVRLALTFDLLGETRLLGELSDERIREIEALLDAGRTEDLPAALQAYHDTLERFSEATVQITTDAGYSEGQDTQARIAHHIEVLQGLQAGLPMPAQAAIQRAIERSLEHEQEMEARLQDRNQRHAEQIADLYTVPVEEVLEVFSNQCDQKWNCVREHFREAELEETVPVPPPFPPGLEDGRPGMTQ